MITPIYANEQAPSCYHAAIFLAGPRTDKDASWRPNVLRDIQAFYQSEDLNIVVFIPEPRHQSFDSNNYVGQLEWEKQHLDMADAILAWVPTDMTSSLIGLTTHVEFGRYVESGKLFYGRPDGADHMSYLDWMYTDVTKRQPITRLADLINQVTSYLQEKLAQCDRSDRTAGERYVPLHIWSTKLFQNWYQSQRQVGNQLVSAKVLWTFLIHQVNLTFSYALHVNVWIAAEDRIKSNEFILSRTDISVVVPYWRHPTDVFASEIVLIKEFRSPARTSDGFVHELPGGSAFKKSGILQVASDELYEETSIRISYDRFKHLDSKQLAATWSTHFANVYAVELRQVEIDYAKEIAASGQTFGVKKDTEKTYVEVCQLRDIGKYVDWSMEGMIYRAILG
jgi:8-oxo-dGTP pyrophosphatase MutT (NUDIX family)